MDVYQTFKKQDYKLRFSKIKVTRTVLPVINKTIEYNSTKNELQCKNLYRKFIQGVSLIKSALPIELYRKSRDNNYEYYLNYLTKNLQVTL